MHAPHHPHNINDDNVINRSSLLHGETNREEPSYLELSNVSNVSRVYGKQVVSHVYGIQVADNQGGVANAWEVWKQRKWLAILIFIAVFTAVVSVTMLLPAIYQSTTTIVI